MLNNRPVPLREIPYQSGLALIRGIQLHRQDPPGIPEGLPANVAHYSWGGLSVWLDQQNRRAWLSSTRWSRVPNTAR